MSAAPPDYVLSVPAHQGASRKSSLYIDAVWLLGALAIGVALRVPSVGDGYWVDEGISVGIAGHRLSQIPGLLRLDGSPPLYYVLLHYWIRLFGTSPEATHLLSLIPSIAIIPVMWWGTRAIFGHQAARWSTLLAAVSPFLVGYGTETRMYSMVALVGLVFAVCFVKAMVAGQRRYLTGLVLSGIALCYLHSWGPYAVVALASTGLGLGIVRRSRETLVDALTSSATIVLCYLPWVPTLIQQMSHTGAPWSAGTNVGEMLIDIGGAFGGGLAVVVLASLAVGLGWTRSALVDLDEQWRLSVASLGVLVLFVVATAALAAIVVPSWDERYLAVVVGPMLMLACAVLVKARPGRVALGVAVICMLVPTVMHLSSPVSERQWSKSNVGLVAEVLGRYLRPGDLVISNQITEGPVLYHYLPAGLKYATPLGATTDPAVVDWRNLQPRLRAAQPTESLASLIDALPPGAHVLLIDPYGWSAQTAPSAYSVLLYTQRTVATDFVLGDYQQLTVVRSMDPARPEPTTPVAGFLLVKR